MTLQLDTGLAPAIGSLNGRPFEQENRELRGLAVRIKALQFSIESLSPDAKCADISGDIAQIKKELKAMKQRKEFYEKYSDCVSRFRCSEPDNELGEPQTLGATKEKLGDFKKNILTCQQAVRNAKDALVRFLNPDAASQDYQAIRVGFRFHR